MEIYEAPAITELGSVESLTNGSGGQSAWDGNYGIFGFVGHILDNGGGYGS